MADLIATCPVCPGDPVKFIARTDGGPVEIDAEAFGPWRVHPRILNGPGAPLSADAWTVSYMNGLGMARAIAFLLDDVISQDDARTVAKALADDSRLSGVDGGPLAERIAEIVREVVDMACFRIRCHREFARIDEQETRHG